MLKKIIAISILFVVLLSAGCTTAPKQVKTTKTAASTVQKTSTTTSSPAVSTNSGITVIAAGSLGYALKDLGQKWREVYPNTPILPGGGIFMGSIKGGKQIGVLHRQYDVYASAASSVIPQVLAPKYASWMIVFATNQVSVLYSQSSKAPITIEGKTYPVSDINNQNWWKFVTAPGVTIGVSNGSLDPAGFQAIQAMKLAGIYLVQHDNTAYNAWFHKELNYPVNDTNAIFQAIWIHKTKTGYLRPVGIEASLDAMIKTGAPYFGISYRSLAKSYGLGYIQLPWQVNLGYTNESAIRYYSQINSSGAPMGLSGSSSEAAQSGAPIFYAVTIPTNAPNKVLAKNYIMLLLGPIGQQVLKDTYFKPLSKPYFVPFNSKVTLPSGLSPYTQKLPARLQSGPGYKAMMGS